MNARVWIICGSLCLTLAGCSREPFDEATQHMMAARTALSEDNKEVAMQELTAAIEKGGSAWAYFERAKLHADAGDTDAAKADCRKALEIDPENDEIKWYLGQLDRPSDQRFQSPPPSASK
jgi:lipoprotein NlpI